MKLFILLMLCVLTVEAKTEKEYQAQHCPGRMEVVLPDRTRIDCETTIYVIEFDWAKKWAEGIGQSLHYGLMTGKTPGLTLITESEKDCKYVGRAANIIKEYWLPVRLQTVGPFKCMGH